MNWLRDINYFRPDELILFLILTEDKFIVGVDVNVCAGYDCNTAVEPSAVVLTIKRSQHLRRYFQPR